MPPPQNVEAAAPTIGAGVPDDRATTEARLIATGKLEEEAKEADHKRRERLRNHLILAVIVLFWIFVGLAIVGIAIFAWHQMAPNSWSWLSERQLDKLQTILFSGALVGLGGHIARRYLT